MNLVTNVSVPSSSSSMFKQQLSGSKSLTDDAENEESCDIFLKTFTAFLTHARDKTRTVPIITINILFLSQKYSDKDTVRIFY